MSGIVEKDLLRVRLRFIDVCKSFFMGEPDSEKMSRWRGLMSALLQEHLNPNLDKAVSEIHTQMKSKNLEKLQEEYYQLFIDPYDKNRVQLDASYHMDGRSYGMTLAKFRGYLQERQLEKKGPCTETEDSLVVMLDVFGTLIEKEERGQEISSESQVVLLEEFLEPFVSKLTKVFQNNGTAEFYASCIRFIQGYLDLEKSLIG